MAPQECALSHGAISVFILLEHLYDGIKQCICLFLVDIINPAVQWDIQQYKVGDPILFLDSDRFFPIIHNNMKGIIKGIEILNPDTHEERIQFDVEIPKVVDESDLWRINLELLECWESEEKSLVRFCVHKLKSADEDGDESISLTVVPQAIKNHIYKLETLKTAAEQANTALANGDISQEQYDSLQREIIETENDLKKLETQANQSATAMQKIAASGEKLKTTGDNIASAGQKMLPVTAAVTGLGTAAVTTAASFESSMSQVQATMGITKDSMSNVDGQSVNTMKTLSELAKKMGSETAFSASECAQALNYLALAGYDTQEMCDTLPTVLNLAAAGDIELASASDMVTDAMSALGMETSEADTMVDQMAMDAKGEVLITIMASLAQQESQSLSQNVKLGLQFRYQNGQVQVNHNHFLGYTKDADGNLIIDPEQAEVVKRIYREYLEGSSMDKIAAGLEKDGILTGAGKTKWWASTVKKILTNEKYIGDALLQKTYTTDFLNKTRVKNNGIVPQYYVEGNHEAIIPKDIYLQVQEELVRRRVVKTSANGKKRSYSCNHCFAQIVVCGDCGEMFRRIHWNNRGCKSIVWRCISRLEPGLECHARTVNETILEDVVVQAINKLLGDKSTYQAQLQQNIAKVIREAQQTTADGIDERLQELQKELLKKANNKEAYDEIADEIFKLREQRQQNTVDTAARDAQIGRINELQDYIKDQDATLTEFDEALVKRWLKQITVFEDHFTVELKSGLTIDIEG